MSRTIVSAASSNHFRSLLNFICSVRNYEPEVDLIVYDLGLTKSETEHLQNIGVTPIKFDYSKYPSYFDVHVAAGEYAWKPTIIKETCDRQGGKVVWCDAGNLLTGPLKVWNVIDTTGIQSNVSSNTVAFWTHPLTLKFMNVCEEHKKLPNRNAACLAFNCEIEWVREFVSEFARHALTRDCICPEGSSRLNHRQDQAVFTCMYYKYRDTYNFDTVCCGDIMTHCDVD